MTLAASTTPPPFGFPLTPFIAKPAVKFRRIWQDAQLPRQATEGAACFDLIAYSTGVLNGNNSILVVDTGIQIELPPGHVGLVCSRSGLAARQGIFVLNAPGIIDEDYRGEIKVILARHEADQNWPDISPSIVQKGDRIAQLMILSLPQISAIEVTDLSSTTRGAGGLGSTGVQ